MFARVSIIQGSPDRLDEAARRYQEQAVPFIRQLSGFKGSYWMADRRSGKSLTVALWESEESMRASEAVVEQRRKEAAQAVGATIESVEEYEVIAQG